MKLRVEHGAPPGVEPVISSSRTRRAGLRYSERNESRHERLARPPSDDGNHATPPRGASAIDAGLLPRGGDVFATSKL